MRVTHEEQQAVELTQVLEKFLKTLQLKRLKVEICVGDPCTGKVTEPRMMSTLYYKGLAVLQLPGDLVERGLKWTVTHVASGRAIVRCRSRTEARIALSAAVYSGVEWMQEGDALSVDAWAGRVVENASRIADGRWTGVTEKLLFMDARREHECSDDFELEW